MFDIIHTGYLLFQFITINNRFQFSLICLQFRWSLRKIFAFHAPCLYLIGMTSFDPFLSRNNPIIITEGRAIRVKCVKWMWSSQILLIDRSILSSTCPVSLYRLSFLILLLKRKLLSLSWRLASYLRKLFRSFSKRLVVSKVSEYLFNYDYHFVINHEAKSNDYNCGWSETRDKYFLRIPRP